MIRFGVMPLGSDALFSDHFERALLGADWTLNDNTVPNDAVADIDGGWAHVDATSDNTLPLDVAWIEAPVGAFASGDVTEIDTLFYFNNPVDPTFGRSYQFFLLLTDAGQSPFHTSSHGWLIQGGSGAGEPDQWRLFEVVNGLAGTQTVKFTTHGITVPTSEILAAQIVAELTFGAGGGISLTYIGSATQASSSGATVHTGTKVLQLGVGARATSTRGEAWWDHVTVGAGGHLLLAGRPI